RAGGSRGSSVARTGAAFTPPPLTRLAVGLLRCFGRGLRMRRPALAFGLLLGLLGGAPGGDDLLEGAETEDEEDSPQPGQRREGCDRDLLAHRVGGDHGR